jgi:iron complex outermembrane recepter protein
MKIHGQPATPRETFNIDLKPLVLFVSAALAMPAALAQGSGFAIEEIIVTSRKRVESLQDTPVAVSAFTQRELELRQISSTDQLGEVTPNLTFDAFAPSSGSNASSQIFIRGIGQTDFTAVTDPGVGLYVDGVYYARSIGGATSFLEMERVEVLKGPQGTLFGRNTIGGAILLHPKRPDAEFGGNAELKVGSDNMLNTTVNLNMPLSEKVLSKLTLASTSRDGYVERTFDDQMLGDDETLSGRIALQWNPTDELELYFTGDYTKENEAGAPAVSLGMNEQGTHAYLANIFVLADCPLTPPPGPPGAARMTNNNPNCLNDTAFIGEYKSGGTAEVASRLEYWGMQLTAEWDVNDWLTIESITGYRDLDSYSARDADHTAVDLFATIDVFIHEQFSQELQFRGSSLDDRLEWIVGLYYFEEEADNLNPVQLLPGFVGELSSGGQVENDNIAIFSQATFDATDDLSVTAGVRYTDETKRFLPYSFIPEGSTYFFGGGPGTANRYVDCPTGAEAGCVVPGVAGVRLEAGDALVPQQWVEQSFEATNVMLNVAYDINVDVMVYASYSEGFKSGGFDQRFNAPFDAVTTFDPEEATTYEAGIKSSWLDNSLVVNAAAFFTDYEDMQLIVIEGIAPITVNAGEAEITGLELELTYVPSHAWLFSMGVGFIDGEYKQLGDQVLNTTPITLTSEFAQTPEVSANIGISYSRDFTWGSIVPRLDWIYTDDTYQDASNDEKLLSDSYDLINASISFTTIDDTWEVVLAGRNLTDESYLIAGRSSYNSATAYSAGTFSRQREWSLSAQYNF